MKRGLIVGKFSPLHQGHEAIIKFGMSHCDKLTVLSYSNPEFLGCEARIRRRWLKMLFPKVECFVLDRAALEKYPALKGLSIPANDASDEAHRHFVGDIVEKLMGAPVDVVFTSENYGPGFAEALATRFKHPVEHKAFDTERLKFAVSGTRLRENLFQHRHFLSPIVYSSFIKTAVFLGGESTGKSSLAEAAAKTYQTVFVPEYGRTLWEERKGKLAFDDLLLIAKTHVENERKAILEASKFLFVDTSPLTTMLYSQHLFKLVDPDLDDLSHRHYDYTFLCGDEFPFVQDGTRQDAKFRSWQQKTYVDWLTARGEDFVTLTGDPKTRLAKVQTTLG